jgi:hypothetical protein
MESKIKIRVTEWRVFSHDDRIIGCIRRNPDAGPDPDQYLAFCYRTLDTSIFGTFAEAVDYLRASQSAVSA